MSCQISILLAAFLWLHTTATPSGEHTCTGVVKHPVTVLVNVTEPVTFRSYTWCLRVPPRCSKYTVQLKDRVKLHTEMHNKTITVCCRGYVEMENKCVPACPEEADCPFMKCNRTNHCHCIPGYNGLYCNDPCPRGLWGKDCKRPCDCPTGYTCHHLTGDCFVDDRPPRRTTTTTTTTRKPTTTTTTPTTEGTTMETVKTPVFRFPPPPWVDSTSAGKKTTTRQVKKEEAPKNIELETVRANTQDVVSVSTTAIEEMTRKPNIERPTLEFLPPLTTANPSTGRTEPENTTSAESAITTTTSIATPPPVKAPTQSQAETTLPTISRPFKPILILRTTTEDTQTSPTGTHPRTIATTSAETTPTVITTQPPPKILLINTEPPPTTILESMSTLAIKTTLPTGKSGLLSEPTESTTERILRTSYVTHYDINSAKITLGNEAQPELFDSKSNVPQDESTPVSDTASSVNSTSSLKSFVPFSTTSYHQPKPTMNIAEQGVDQRRTTLPTTLLTKLTEEFHADIIRNQEKRYEDTIFPKSGDIKHNFEIKTTPYHTTEKLIVSESLLTNALPELTDPLKIPTPVTISQLKTTVVTGTNINQTATTMPPTIATSLPTNDSPPLAPVAKATPPTSMESAVTAMEKPTSITTPALKSITTIKPQIDDSIPPITPAFVPVNASPSNIDETTEPNPEVIAAKNNPTTPLEIVKTATLITTANTPSHPTVKYGSIRQKFETNIQTKSTIAAYGAYDEVSSPSTSTTRLPLPAIIEEVFKELNLYKKTKLEETPISNSAPDKTKKKHEKTKSKNINAKEYPSNQQTKPDKYEEEFQPTTEITFKSLLHAETNTNKSSSTKSPLIIKKQPDFIVDRKHVTEELPSTDVGNRKPPTPISPNQLWHPFKKQTNASEMDLKEQEGELHTLEEPSRITQPIVEATEMSKVMESNTIDYHYQNSEGPLRKTASKEEYTNYSLIFNKIKFNMTDSVAEGVKASVETRRSYLHTPMILILGVALVTLLLLTLTLWVYLKRRRERQVPFPPCIMAYALQEPPPIDSDIFDHPLFCTTFTNNYGERINRELRELSYDHPRRIEPEPLYAEIRH